MSKSFFTDLSRLKPDTTNETLEESNVVKLDHLPTEIHVKILSLLDLPDVLAYSSTCKLFYKYSEDQNLWKLQWIRFSLRTPFSFLPTTSISELGVNFKDACRRLWMVLVSDSNPTFGGLNPVKCDFCRQYTCTPTCIEERRGFKVAIDIGGKTTKMIREDFRQESHYTMAAIPKLLKCIDCDKTFTREEVFGAMDDLVPGYCQHRSVASHTGLEYRSQALTQCDENQPFCLFCDEDRMNRFLCEREVVAETRQKLESMDRMQYFSSLTEEEYRNQESFLPLTNGYCKDYSDILSAESLDLVSPWLAFEHVEAFPIVKSFLSHLLIHYKFEEFIQIPNNALIVTIPTRIPHCVKESLVKFLFEETKAARICLLPKPLAVAQLFNVTTCIVVDSGATNTSVWVVIDGKIVESRNQSINVGGWHVSECLKRALDTNSITVSSLDNSAVKQKCWLSLNLNREQSVSETLHVKSQRENSAILNNGYYNNPYHMVHHQKLEMTEITMSSELFVAPEMMYASLDLPERVAEATRDLPDHVLKECFSNILITGGNTDLRGFDKRFSRDLREKMPEHSPIINVRTDTCGDHSWNTAYGAYTVPVPIPYENILNILDDPGRALWMTREEYIIFGSQNLAINDHLLDEDG